MSAIGGCGTASACDVCLFDRLSLRRTKSSARACASTGSICIASIGQWICRVCMVRQANAANRAGHPRRHTLACTSSAERPHNCIEIVAHSALTSSACMLEHLPQSNRARLCHEPQTAACSLHCTASCTSAYKLCTRYCTSRRIVMLMLDVVVTSRLPFACIAI